MEGWIEIIVSVLSGLVVAIPLVWNLVKFVRKSIIEKNWKSLLDLTLDYMEEAEAKFSNGADKRQWVVAMVAVAARRINYEIDEEQIGAMVDNLCAMSKVVNA